MIATGSGLYFKKIIQKLTFLDISRSYGFGAQVMNFFIKPFTKTISQGAATNVYLAGSNEIHDVRCFSQYSLLSKKNSKK